MTPAPTLSAGPATRPFPRAFATASRAGGLAIALATCSLFQTANAQADWTTIAQEGQSFTLPAAKLVRYGQPWTPAWTAERSMTGPVACNNATFGDPSPGTGKQCQTKDLAATPAPSPILPPLTSGLTYVVRWTPPTTNTDGSPIGTVLKTLVQASTDSTFASYYQWEATVPGASSVQVNNGPSGTIYWRARVETANGTSDYSATAISDREFVAQTRPPCWPKPVGSGSWVKARQNASGWAIYWQCQTPTGYQHQGVIGLWAQMDADWMAQLATALAGGEGAFTALWNARASSSLNPAQYDPVRALYTAMRNENPLPTAPAYQVAPNGTYTTRPAYSIVNGARTSTAVGRVAVAAPCDCAAFKSGTTTPYCAVTGQPNVATADPADRLPASAALCRAGP